MGLCSFRAAPRQGHLDRIHKIYGYLRKQPDVNIRFRTGMLPNDELVHMDDHDWMYTVYGEDCKEDEGKDLPPPKGKPGRMTTLWMPTCTIVK